MPGKNTIAVAKGDGIGPEIMDAVLSIFNAAGVPLDYEFVEMGKSIFDKGVSTGITELAKEVIEKRGILFKGPMETPKGKGVKSINVTARKIWNTYANVRRFRTLKGVDTLFSKAGISINMTVLRENIEDTYGGIEYLHSKDVAIGYRIITREGTKQFMEFAFDYARKNGITEVVCGHKANIMKLTDGMFMNTFYEVAAQYPDIHVSDLIVDDLAMKLVRIPEKFRLIVLSNLQGDILSDLCAGLVGGLGFAPSANIGDRISIFEAVHGTAPDIAGRGIANPCSLLISGLMMLRHLGLISFADQIENALLVTLEKGVHTGDFGDRNIPSSSTMSFARAVIDNLGEEPHEAEKVHTNVKDFKKMHAGKPEDVNVMGSNSVAGEVIGMDVFINTDLHPDDLASTVKSSLPGQWELQVIANRGTQVWPDKSVFTVCVAHYQLRILTNGSSVKSMLEWCDVFSEILQVADVEILRDFDGLKGYSMVQGQ
jgi:isocitrate dehydrogenase